MGELRHFISATLRPDLNAKCPQRRTGSRSNDLEPSVGPRAGPSRGRDRLKLTPDQQVYCFEVNPSPAFSYYEAHTGQPIAQAIARYLAAAARVRA